MVGDALFNGPKSALPTSWMQVTGPPREARVANGRCDVKRVALAFPSMRIARHSSAVAVSE